MNLTGTDLSLINLTTNFNVCELNQLKLVEETAKLPKMLFWISLAIFTALLIHFWFIPWLKKWKHYEYINEAFAGFAFALSIFLLIFMWLFTYQIDAATLKHISNVTLWILVPIVIIRVGYIAWKYLKTFE